MTPERAANYEGDEEESADIKRAFNTASEGGLTAVPTYQWGESLAEVGDRILVPLNLNGLEAAEMELDHDGAEVLADMLLGAIAPEDPYRGPRTECAGIWMTGRIPEADARRAALDHHTDLRDGGQRGIDELEAGAPVVYWIDDADGPKPEQQVAQQG